MPNGPKIKRLLEKFGIPMRGKSEAQIASMETGVTKHPTQGRQRSIDERLAVSKGVKKERSSITKEEAKKRMKGLDEFWKHPNEQNKEVRTRIAGSLRKAVAEGTYIEKAVVNMLTGMGCVVQTHVKNIFGNIGIEADILCDSMIVLEMDGPRHYKCFLHNDLSTLTKTIQTDNRKNAMVVNTPGAWIIRVLYPYHTELYHVHPMLQRLKAAVELIKKMAGQEVPPHKRVVILDMKQVIEGVSCYSNPEYQAALKLVR